MLLVTWTKKRNTENYSYNNDYNFILAIVYNADYHKSILDEDDTALKRSNS